MQEIDQTANPFPGLRPFESTETHLFFGRDGQSEELLRRLKRTRFLAVVGTSGSGKSSLVRAGLLPALQGGLMASAGSDWRIAILRPGSDPIGNLARALAHPAVLGSRDEKSDDIQAVMAETTLRRSSLGLAELVSRARTKLDEHGEPLFPDYENLLVVVDQFEELFRFKQLIEEENSKEDAAAFVRLLLEAVGQKAEKIYVVLTMRSDFLGDCSQFWELPEAINNGQYLIPRMTRDERREAISGPVAVGQGAISEPLINQLLNDVGDNPDQLPILQHALMRTWDHWLTHRNGKPIDIPDYEAIGGMAEALSLHADEAYAELNDSQKVIAEKLFKGLTEKGSDNREIRRPMEVEEICKVTGADEAAVISVVEIFRSEGRSFLMPPPTDALTGAQVKLNRESLIDISHESLIRNWDRLKKWTDEEAQSARIYKRLAETAMLHQAEAEALLVDPALQGALDWREKNNPNAVWARRYHPEFATAMDFLDQSAAARDAQAQAREQQRRREATYKRSRWVLIVLALAFTLSLAALTYARAALSRADRANAEARHQLELAMAQANEATAQRKAAEEQAKMADEESHLAKHETKLAKEAQQVALKEKRLAIAAKDAAKLAEAIAVREAGLADAAKNEAVLEKQKALEARKQSLNSFHAADMNLVNLAYDANNVETGIDLLEAHAPGDEVSPDFVWYYFWRKFHSEKNTLVPFPNEDRRILEVTMSDDRKVLLYGRWGHFRIVETESQKELGSINIADGSLVAMSAKLFAFSKGGTLKLIDTVTQQERGKLELPGHTDALTSATFSPDRTHIATGSKDHTVRLWEVATQREVSKFSLGEGVADYVVFSPDGKALAAHGSGGEVRVWKIAAPSPHVINCKLCTNIQLIKAHTNLLIVTRRSDDGSLEFIDTETGKQFSTFFDRKARVTSFDSSPNDPVVAVGYGNGTIKLLSSPSLSELAVLNGYPEPVGFLGFSEDGTVLVSESGGTLKFWDVKTRLKERSPLVGSSEYVSSVAYSPDGKTLTTREDNGTVKLWDTTSHQELASFTTKSNLATALAFSPDGKTLATAGPDGAVKVWDIISHRELATLKGHSKTVSSIAFSPDAKRLASASDDGTAKVWDTTSYQELATLRLHTENVGAVAFSSDGKMVAIQIHEDSVKLWDVASNKELASLISEFGPIEHLELSPDGETLATSSGAHVTFWSISTYQKLASIRGGGEAVYALAFSPDGRTFAFGGDAQDIKLWSTASRRELAKLSGHNGTVRSLAFSPDGRTLASAADDGTARLWHAATDAEVEAQRRKPSPSPSP